MTDFHLQSAYSPAGDQPKAIEELTKGLEDNVKHQVLLGVTGSGKTYTIANLIQKVKRPTLIISHNKTLAGQLYQEFRDFFPENAVSYFVSYYDYYQPEAYIPTTDTYIEKTTAINEEIDRLRLLTTTNLMNRDDVIVIASVSCIYNLGNPEEYTNHVLLLTLGEKRSRHQLLLELVQMQYQRSDLDLKRGTFRVRGDIVEIWPAYKENVLRLHFLGDILERIEWLDALTFKPLDGTENLKDYMLFPAKHYITDPKKQEEAIREIRYDLDNRVKELKANGKELEAHRLDQKVNYDLDMIQEVGFVNGIENYSRYFDGRVKGEPPYSLLEFFRQKKDWLLVIDESHITLPQIRGMYNGDQARKKVLIDYGFRLPAALDNRPLRFDEFFERCPQTVYVSATPGDWEMQLPKTKVVQQVVRPTGLIDPLIEVRPSENQIEDLTREIIKRKKLGQRVLITTITKRLAEALTDYLNDSNNFYKFIDEHEGDTIEKIQPKVAYLHSDIDTLDRQDVLDDLRSGEFDVLVGINLLREGLDLPEVSLVAILDADKEGFLRSKSSLIQIMGRAARHLEGLAILYADRMTKSMSEAIAETTRRRDLQIQYNTDHGITPTSIQKVIREKLIKHAKERDKDISLAIKVSPTSKDIDVKSLDPKDFAPDDKKRLIKQLRHLMLAAAKDLRFEEATLLRDKLREFDEHLI